MVACGKRGTDGGAPLTEVDQGTSQPVGLLCMTTRRQTLGWTSKGSSEYQDQDLNTDSKYLGISTDLIPCNNPSRYPHLFVIHGTWTIKGP